MVEHFQSAADAAGQNRTAGPDGRVRSAGEHLLGATPQPLSIKAGLALLAAGVLNAVVVLRDAIVHATIGWLLIGPIVIYVLYRLLRPVLARAATRPPT